MTELEEIQLRLSHLELKLAAAERERKILDVRQKGFAMVAALLFVFSIAATRSYSANGPSVITCAGLNIVNSAGKSVVKLNNDERGGVVQLNGADGVGRVRLDVGALGQGQLVTRGNKSEELMSVSADEDGGAMRVCGHEGKTRVLIACQTGDPNAGLINIRDNKGDERVNIGSDLVGGQVTVGNSDKLITARLGSDTRGGFFYLYGLDHVAHVVMATGDSNVGLINTRDGQGKTRVILGDDKNGGQVIVNGEDEKPRAAMLVGADGVGTISLLDKSGSVKP